MGPAPPLRKRASTHESPLSPRRGGFGAVPPYHRAKPMLARLSMVWSRAGGVFGTRLKSRFAPMFTGFGTVVRLRFWLHSRLMVRAIWVLRPWRSKVLVTPGVLRPGQTGETHVW